MIVDDWAQSGLAALTGEATGRPDLTRAPVLARARRTLATFVDITDTSSDDRLPPLDAAEFLSGRSALTGHTRNGGVSAGGASRLIEAADGWFALSLARPDDHETVPALLESDITIDTWAAVRQAAPRKPAADWVARARLLGLAAAMPGECAPAEPIVVPRGPRTAPPAWADLLVVDLSSLWAGPLCTHLLMWAGATVVKVESRVRPDGARRGNRRFFDWMNSGKLSYAADFNEDPSCLRRLLMAADVVLEASRPRALRAHGLSADDLPARPGQVWARITGHGSTGPGADWIGFGDDAAVAGGLIAGTPTAPMFCGDAIADPLTGLETATAVATALRTGGGVGIDIALARVAATYAALGVIDLPADPPAEPPAVSPPRAPTGIDLIPPAAELGADNPAVDAIVSRRLGG